MYYLIFLGICARQLVGIREGTRTTKLTNYFFLSRASGKILKAYAQDFETLSNDGHMFVIVQNTGYVTADFAVSLNILLNVSFGLKAL